MSVDDDDFELHRLEVFTRARLRECGDDYPTPFVAQGSNADGVHLGPLCGFPSIDRLSEFVKIMTPDVVEVYAAQGESSQAIFDAIVQGVH